MAHLVERLLDRSVLSLSDKRDYDIQCLILENLRTIWGGLITVGYWLFRIVGIPKSENGCKFVMSDLV
jgi:hypothetical protein